MPSQPFVFVYKPRKTWAICSPSDLRYQSKLSHLIDLSRAGYYSLKTQSRSMDAGSKNQRVGLALIGAGIFAKEA